MSQSSFFGLQTSVPTWLNVILVIILTILAGIMAGLMLCVFSLDVNRLNTMTQSGSARDAFLAKRVLLILDKPHWLLITILLWDDIALEMMPLLLNMFLHPVAAVIVSVAITLVFCEIIPQAVFIHNAFVVSAYFAPFVYVLMWISAPVAWPLGKLLDLVVGDKESVFFQRRELRELIRSQEEIRERLRHENSEEDYEAGATSDPDEGEDDLTKEEVTIMLNVLSLSESIAKGMLQTPIESMFTLHVDDVVTQHVVDVVFNNGYSFVPVYEDASDPTSVTLVLMTKALLLLVYRNEDDNTRVRELPLMPLARMSGSTQGTEVFLALQDMSPAMVAITDAPSSSMSSGKIQQQETGKTLGILTLRNVIELVHQTTFKAELDPRNPSPMQLVMRSWRVYRRVGEYGVGPSHKSNKPRHSRSQRHFQSQLGDSWQRDHTPMARITSEDRLSLTTLQEQGGGFGSGSLRESPLSPDSTLNQGAPKAAPDER